MDLTPDAMLGVFDMFDKFKKKFGKKTDPESKPEAPKPKTKKKTDKEIATERGEPYVNIVSVELDPDNVGAGAFELDWNEFFIAKLVRAGYQASPSEDDATIVDRWFESVCRHVALATYEQEMADPENRPRVERRDLGNGRTEVK